MMKRVVFFVVLVGFVLLSLSAAYADDVFIGFGVNGGAPSPFAASATGTVTYSNPTFLGWNVNAIAFGSPSAGPEPNLEGFTVNASDISSGVTSLQVYITEAGLSSPTGVNTFVSGLTSNFILGGITSVTESTYVDTGNGLFALTSLLSSATFTGIGHQSLSAATPSLASPYSETEVFDIAATGVGTVQDTITISNAPEPGTLTLFGSGLIGLAGLLRRKLALV
jgi:hypothetical protein